MRAIRALWTYSSIMRSLIWRFALTGDYRRTLSYIASWFETVLLVLTVLALCGYGDERK